MRLVASIAVALWASLAWSASDEEQVLRDLGPDKKVGLCTFGLKGADAGKNEMVFWLGLMGQALNANRADSLRSTAWQIPKPGNS